MSKIFSSIDPETAKRKLITFALWVIGIYLTLFVIASKRYEHEVGIIEGRVNAIFTQLETPDFKKAINHIPAVQQMECPTEPDIKNPVSIYHSFLTDTIYPEMVEKLKEAVEIRKTELDSIHLIGANLVGANLMGAQLTGGNLSGTDLTGANLMGANLMGANLSKTDLVGADLFGADLSEAHLMGTKLMGANLVKANLSRTDLTEADLRKANLIETVLSEPHLTGANLGGANFWKAKFISIEQLSKAKTLYQSQNLAPELKERIEQDYPHLLEKPKD